MPDGHLPCSDWDWKSGRPEDPLAGCIRIGELSWDFEISRTHRSPGDRCRRAPELVNGPPEQFPRPMAMPPGERIYGGARFRFDAWPRSGGPRLTAPLHLMGPR